MIPMNDEAVRAAVELVGRSGARHLQVGYLHDDVPAAEADWYAHAQYQGARITAERHQGPVEALEALAVRLLTGAQCQHCKGLVSLSPAVGAFFPNATYPGGVKFTEAEARSRPLCRWRRVGPQWVRGCEAAS